MQVYRIVELRNYDVLVPFICQKCGSCCRGFAPQIPVGDFPAIAMHLVKTLKRLKDYRVIFDSNNKMQLKLCRFSRYYPAVVEHLSFFPEVPGIQ